jgi:hypothetical protein
MQDENGASGPGPEGGPAPGYPPSAEPGTPPEPAAGRALTVPRPETGEARVDAALSVLDDLTELPVAEHPAIFEHVHAQLSEVLEELGSASRPGPAGTDGS